jgi:hypothetical protein
MNKQLIYFTSTLLLLMAATLSVPAQETDVALNNASMNSTSMNDTITNNTAINDTSTNNTITNGIVMNNTLNSTLNSTAINGTALNETDSAPALNGSSLSEPSLNETAMTSSNATQEPPSQTNSSAEINPAENMGENAAENQVQAVQEDNMAKTSFVIGAGLQSDKVFVVNGNAKPKQTFEAGIPIKPLRDTSKMFFVCNIV